jgi:hypothetical protein
MAVRRATAAARSRLIVDVSAELRLPGTAAVTEPLGTQRVGGSTVDRVLETLQANVFLVLVLAAGAALQLVLSRGAIISDAWYSLLGGRIVGRDGLPGHDALTAMTLGRDWVDQQWLGHLSLYGLWVLGSWPLLLLAIVGLYVGAVALASAAARMLGASERAVAVVALLCFVTGLPNTVIRAQLLAYPLFATVLLLLLLDERRQSRRVVLVFPLLILWANLHGSVVLGAGLVALRGITLCATMLNRRAPAASWAPRALLLLLAPWVCVFASPYATALPGYYHRTLANGSFGHIVSEWAPSTVQSQPLFFVVLLLGLWLVFGHGRVLGPFARLALVLSGIAGLVAVRNVVWFALVAAAVLPLALDAAWPSRPAPRHRRLNLALAAAAAAGFAVVAIATLGHGRTWFERDFPKGAGDAAAAAAAADPNVKVFASERYADWLLFEHPAVRGRVAYDIRFELLSARQLQSVYDFVYQRGSHWQRAARGYGVLVLDAQHERAVVKYYLARAHAQMLYRDAHVAVLKVRPAPA